MNWSRDCGEFGGFSIDLLPGGVGQLRGYDGCAVEAVTVGHVHERDLDIALSEALAPVPRDLGTCGAPVPDVRGHLGLGPHSPGPFSLLREVIALVLVGAALAARAVGKARWPDAEPSAQWFLAAIAGLLVFFAVPLQALAIVYAAGILAVTSLRSPVANASLAAGSITGLAASLAGGLATYELASSSDRYVGPCSLAWLPRSSCSPPSLAWRRPG